LFGPATFGGLSRRRLTISIQRIYIAAGEREERDESRSIGEKQAFKGTCAMEVEDVQMQMQSYLCQLGIKDLEEIAKTLGCSESDVNEKNRKGLVRLIEGRPESKLEGAKAEKLEYLEEFKSQMTEQ